jgi:CRP/FNR family transcriptional regulator, anaerobic regulatory protein
LAIVLSQSDIFRPEIADLAMRGEAALLAAMSPIPRVLRRGDLLVQMEEAHEFVYAVNSGWLARTRTMPDGRRQIIVIFLPGEFCGIKTVFMTRQPDAIEALTASSARRIHYREVCALAAKNFAVALHLARQLAEDERHLHNWNVRLGQANAEERVAALLLELRSRLLRLGVRAEDRYTLPLTQEQIADHVGLTTVHVNRVLRRFRRLNMVAIRRGEVAFQGNVSALEELARPVQDLVGE